MQINEKKILVVIQTFTTCKKKIFAVIKSCTRKKCVLKEVAFVNVYGWKGKGLLPCATVYSDSILLLPVSKDSQLNPECDYVFPRGLFQINELFHQLFFETNSHLEKHELKQRIQ